MVYLGEDLEKYYSKGILKQVQKELWSEGMPPMEYELTHVKVFEEFWDKTDSIWGYTFWTSNYR